MDKKNPTNPTIRGSMFFAPTDPSWLQADVARTGNGATLSLGG